MSRGATSARPSALRRTIEFAGAHRVALALAAAIALLVPTGILAARWLEARPALRAEELLASNRPEAARDLLAGAVERRPGDTKLRLLQGRALHRIRGAAPAGVEAYAKALDLDPRALDGAALADLPGDLAADRKVAE